MGHALALTWVQLTASTGLRRPTADCFHQATPCGANDLRWFRNINRMSIAYDFRPRLRPD